MYRSMLTTCGNGHSNTVVVISTNIINGVYCILWMDYSSRIRMRLRVLVVEVSMSEEGDKPRAPNRSPKLLLPLRAAFSCGEFT